MADQPTTTIDPFEAFGNDEDGGEDDDYHHDEEDAAPAQVDPEAMRSTAPADTVEAASPTRSRRSTTAARSAAASQRRRDPNNGVLSHHNGTEQALLQYVTAGLLVTTRRNSDESTSPKNHRSSPRDDNDNDKNDNGNGGADSLDDAISRCTRIMSLVDDFCRSRHWMMHVGDEKGTTVKDFLAKKLLNTVNSSSSFWILEIGTYCGYSTLLMAVTCLEHLQQHRQQRKSQEGRANEGGDSSPSAPIAHIVTVDVNPKFSRVAQQLVQLAHMDTFVKVSFVLLGIGGGDENDDVLTTNVLRAMQGANRTHVDFCFIDHDKDLYLSDLIRLENAKLVRKDTYVCADNVVFFRLDNYRQHVSELARQGIVTTKLVLSRLEYVIDNSNEAIGGQDVVDGLELTEYLADPPVPSIT